MDQPAKLIAENATFQAFINSYIRELDCETWVEKKDWINGHFTSVEPESDHLVVIELPCKKMKYVIEVEYKSLVGRHVFRRSLKFCANDKQWHREDRVTVMISLIQELHLKARAKKCYELVSHYDELILRLLESFHMMTTYIENRMDDLKLYSAKSSFIETEQSLLYGHWLHPTPKSRQGMANWQHKSYAPELKGEFQLHYFQVDCRLVKESSSLKVSASDWIEQSMLKDDPQLRIEEGTCIIPMHPLQSQWLLQQNHVKKAIDRQLIKHLGAKGPLFTATSSLRTVYNKEKDLMYKFSIPVKVTNSLRMNKLNELKAGVNMAKLLSKIPFLDENPLFKIIEDPAYITVDFPNQMESGFEVILRTNSFPRGKDQGISSIASIVQDPLPNQKSRLANLISYLAESESRSEDQIALEWFEKYWNCAIEPLIRLYDEYGIALEAHQQNSVLDISTGYPELYYYRDNQGYYLSKTYDKELHFIEPSLSSTPDLFYEDTMIEDRFTYYLFMNQLFSVIYRFGADHLLEEKRLVEVAFEKLQKLETKLTGIGKKFVYHILNKEKLAYKANLLTRFHDVDELSAELEQAIYTNITNPFLLQHKEEDYAQAISLTF
ncbi:IucA/IucC family protein [Metabacillus litoralis]|uniref:IucA/IucC family protein n=1 Tax=Metabacillus litoralis TaxID=152268 RepID=UPI001CFEB157|nr:IucA/IucC family protein [Metabacillus litoralis]